MKQFCKQNLVAESIAVFVLITCLTKASAVHGDASNEVSKSPNLNYNRSEDHLATKHHNKLGSKFEQNNNGQPSEPALSDPNQNGLNKQEMEEVNRIFQLRKQQQKVRLVIYLICLLA